MCRGRVKNSGTREPRKEDPRLTQVARICAELAGTEMNRLESHAAFMVRNKKFAYYLDNHDGDGMVAIMNCWRNRNQSGIIFPLIWLRGVGWRCGFLTWCGRRKGVFV